MVNGFVFQIVLVLVVWLANNLTFVIIIFLSVI